MDHVDEKHYLNFYKTDQSYFSGRFKITKRDYDDTKQDLIYLQLNVDSLEEKFYAVLGRLGKDLYWTVYYLGLQCDAEKYVSTLTIFNEDKVARMIISISTLKVSTSSVQLGGKRIEQNLILEVKLPLLQAVCMGHG